MILTGKWYHHLIENSQWVVTSVVEEEEEQQQQEQEEQEQGAEERQEEEQEEEEEVITSHYKYICILTLNTLKMTTWVAETCLWSQCNKFTFITLKHIFWYC
jgi:hypothetical protein